MKIATFSTRDLQEQCRKSYVASYRANKESVGDLANYINEGDLREFSSVNDSQYTVYASYYNSGIFLYIASYIVSG